jgi:hypothetical protein
VRRHAGLALLAFASACPAVAETDEAGVPLVDDAHEIVATRLVEASHGPVRVTEIEPRDRSEPGYLTVTYLARRDGDHVDKVEYTGVAETNLNGYPGSWSIDDRLSDWPVIVTETGLAWHGRTCTFLTLTELLPTGPFTLAAFGRSYASDGSTRERADIRGEIVDIERGRSFTVRYTGTRNFEQTYRRASSSVYITFGEDGTGLEDCVGDD